MKKYSILALAVLFLLVLAACGGDEGGGETNDTGTDGGTTSGSPTTVTSQSFFSSSPTCPYGGVRISVGVDDNKNGTLDTAEIDAIEEVCNGAPGATGLATLINTTSAPFANCPDGGVKVEAGLDADEDNVLDANEISSTDYVCNGSTGETGAPGSSGLSALINTTAADIVNCPYGGIKIEVGLDADTDNVLDADEVNAASTSYFCNPGGGSFYTIGGTVSGLEGTLVLRKNGYEDITLTSDGVFTFPTPLVSGAGYDINIITKPSGQFCMITNGTGTISGANVMDVAVTCSNLVPRYSAAPDWNDYVRASDTNTACDGTETGGYSACIHGGEMRALEVEGKSSCTGLTAADALGAFDWTCDSSTNPVKMVSTGLKANKGLSDLIDFDTAAWKPNSVTVYDNETEYNTTPSFGWWTNAVEVDNDGGYLSDPGKIYIVTNDALDSTTGGFIINASSIGFVGKPGVIINGPGAGAGVYVVSADGSAGGAKDFLWIEGSIDSAGGERGISLMSVRFSALRNIKAEYATFSAPKRAGVCLDSSSNNTLTNVKASKNLRGVYLYSSSKNTLTNVTASSNTDGVHMSTSANNTLTDITASNNLNGVVIYQSTDNTLSNITASSNSGHGVYMYTSSHYNTLKNITASNNSMSGVYINWSNYNTLTNVAAANNGFDGVQFYISDYNTLSDIAASNNGSGVSLEQNCDYNSFTGLLKSGNNVTSDCKVAGGLNNPGLVNTTCSLTGAYGSGGTDGYGIGNSSDATFYSGVTLVSSFVGKVITNDVSNQSDTNGAAAYSSISDWVNFDNTYRGWGIDGTFGDSTSRGRVGCSYTAYSTQGSCTISGGIWNGAGRIWDWRLKLGDTGDAGNPAILNALSVPTGDDVLIHAWSDASTTTFLRHAVEIQGDGAGNENTLCESGETCLYTPNIGSYQGHGSLIDETVDGTLTFTDGNITGVTLKRYQTNGY